MMTSKNLGASLETSLGYISLLKLLYYRIELCARLLVQMHREFWEEMVLIWDAGTGVVGSA